MHDETLQIIGSKDNYGSIRSEINKPDHKGKKEKENRINYNSIASIIQHAVTVAALSLCTYAGVTVRIYLILFSEWDEIGDFPSFWAQFVGTLVIGIISVHKEKMQNNYMIIYTALSTGFCGSLTTFSSWNAEAAKVLLQVNHTTLIPVDSSREHYVRIIGYLSILFLGIGMLTSALLFGKNISILISKTISKLKLEMLFKRNIHSCIFPLWTIGAYLAITSSLIGISIYYSSYVILFSLLFGSIGTYIRWQLSTFDKQNYKYLKEFPVGTLLANSLGSLILACITIIISRVQKAGVEQLKLDLLTGISVGLCGCLTTVSTFIYQLISLPFQISIIYTLVSLTIVQSIFITIFHTCV